MLLWIILAAIFGGILSLVGGVFVLLKRNWSHQAMLIATSFAAGVMLAVAFGDALPEAFELGVDSTDATALLRWTLAAIIVFFLFERSLVWFHHHHGPHATQPDPVLPMAWIGDTLHNFVDGVVITTTFFVSVPLGVVTTLAIAAHELPQEVADFSLYLSRGVRKGWVFGLNLASSFASVVGAVLTYFFWDLLSSVQPQLLAFTAGMFAYIACSDLIPELHDDHQKSLIWLQVLMFLSGVASIFILQAILAE